MIEASNALTKEPSADTKTNNTPPALTEYYYYSKYSTKLSTSVKGTAVDR